jgi:hypothetical protein
VASLMAFAQVIAKASGVDCLVAGSVEMPCHDLEAACWVAEFAETQCLEWETVEVVGDIERAWAWALRSQAEEAADMAAFAGVFP